MKIQIVSDIHLEFNDWVEINNAGADILCLAGDICLAEHFARGEPSPYVAKAQQYLRFFDHVSKQFDRVFYVMGNHEHYSGLWNNTANHLRETLALWPNIALLDNQWVEIDRTRIIGTTLWTDMNKGDPLTMMSMPDMMSDYRAIAINNNGAYYKLRPIDTVQEHYRSLETIKLGVETWDGDVVVLGHHTPSHLSIHPKYANQGIMNAAFVNMLDEYIMDHPKIKLWIHGHVHDPWDYMIGETRIVCNPHGYPRERPVWDPNLIVEMP